MMISLLKEYNIGEEFRQMRSVPVRMGEGREDAVLFVHANTGNLDPWCEAMNFPRDTLKLTLISESGERLWQRDLGNGVIPGIWFSPVISFDLDGDGVDEIWLLDNRHPERPFSLEHRILERMDPLTGEITGQWQWPMLPAGCTMSHTYRYCLMGGYVHGEPVLVCSQGTYGDMYLQGYNKDMVLRWKIAIPAKEPGARAAHHTVVFDINGDGIDELFWGERVLSLDDGHELFCGDRDSFNAHSDILVPFEDPQSGKIYVFTCREGQQSAPRVATYDAEMNTIWRSPDGGHMHNGWVAAIGENRRYVAMAMSLALDAKGGDIHRSTPITYYFDAVTGERMENPLPYPGNQVLPIDLDGDGYHEFFIREGERKGEFMDRFGNSLGFGPGSSSVIRAGKILDRPGHQIMLGNGSKGFVGIYGDAEAKGGPGDKYAAYHKAMQHMMASGYNTTHINFGL